MLNYKGLRATLERLVVSQAQVNQQIDKILDQNFKTTAITDRPSQLGDELVLDYAGYCGGEQFPGGTAEKQTLTLGSGMFIPGFEEQLVGKSVGDEVDVNVTFPVPYHSEALAGKAATFKCKIHEIRLKERYRLDDAFAREVGGCGSLAEFRNALKESMQAYMDRQADADVKNHLLDQLVENYECEITREQLEKAVDVELQNLEAQLGRQGLNLDAYCQFASTTKDALREDCVPDARKNIKRQHIISEIAKLEHIEADEASVADEFARVCQENGVTVEALQPYFDKAMEDALVRNVITNKVLDKLMEYADITTVEKHG